MVPGRNLGSPFPGSLFVNTNRTQNQGPSSAKYNLILLGRSETDLQLRVEASTGSNQARGDAKRMLCILLAFARLEVERSETLSRLKGKVPYAIPSVLLARHLVSVEVCMLRTLSCCRAKRAVEKAQRDDCQTRLT
ncbi:hypothetical protein NDU88_002870 [Pleurodeles waltl]|uniref:Uncharacterized protein n=1 Tax=Pleurodeles waltl TaxID=8319 RepID=A0AAV7SCX8_PLEWA|nr:hypothetical protein NDU88_002870 [Pleurodeles waltl]